MDGRSKQSDAEDVKNGQGRRELKERIRFEELLCDLSATFVNLPADSVDKEIEHGLELVVKFLGADRGILMQFSEDGKTLGITHSYIAPGIKPLPFTSVGPGERLLWYEKTLQNGEMVVFENLPDDLPEEAIAERQICIEQGIKSHISIPLSIGKASPKGVVGFTYMRRRRTWPIQCIQRVQFVGHIFASVLRRKQTEEELQMYVVNKNETKRSLN